MLKNIASRVLLIGSVLTLSVTVNAQGFAGLTDGLSYFCFSAIAFIVFAMTMTIYFLNLKNKYLSKANINTGRIYPEQELRRWWSFGNRKWVFYFAIICGVILLTWFSAIRPAISSTPQIISDAKTKATPDHSKVTVADATGIAEGKKIFTGTCFACHGPNGEGNAVGPNLTDKYWLHGGSISDVFKTIADGVPDKGMQPWGKTYSPTEIKNLASFILSLQGTKPQNAKAPQGNLYNGK